MTSYLRNWLWSGTTSTQPTPGYQGSVPTLETTSPQPSDDEDTETETEVDVKVQAENDDEDEDDDVAPAFPSLNSAQRASGSRSSDARDTNSNANANASKTGLSAPTSGPSASKPSSNAAPRILSDAQLMPPPPLPTLAVRTPGVLSSSSSAAGSSKPSTLSVGGGGGLGSLSVPSRPTAGGGGGGLGSSLAVPPSTTKPPPKPTKKREKVALAPGHSALDWANLKSSGADLRGVDSLQRITPSMLKQHNKKDDAWSAFYGKVYNITAYLPFHPGGEKDLMRVAGRDGTKLFATTHGWVNADFMLDACLVGFLVPEPSS